jgi:ABC-type polysaccharide/polyol phosphate transport system ATPase subunit
MTEQFCRSCSAKIVWAFTENGKAIPIDCQKDLTGNIKIEAREGRAVAIVGANGSGHYVSHFATCPNAKPHRKQRAAP